MQEVKPKARSSNLILEALGDELLIYDEESDLAHSLNPTAALVWRESDGRKSIDDLADCLATRTALPRDRDLVIYALDQLRAARLLEPLPAEFQTSGVTRRTLLSRMVLVAGLLPFVLSIVAPPPVMALSNPTGTAG